MEQKVLKRIREIYPEGSRVRLLKMDDTQAPPYGTFGIVRHVDDEGTVHVTWDNGSTLGLVFGEDQCEVVD